jgi:hypothetical protein
MSVRTLSRVWDHSTRSGTELLMLLAIADFADDAGWAYPSVGTLAAKTRMTARNVNHILAALRDSGELEIHRSDGPRGTNRYRIRTGLTPEAGFTPEAHFTLKPASSTPEAGFTPPLKPASPEPSLNHQEPSGAAAEPPAPPEAARRSRTRNPRLTLSAWLDRMKAVGEKPIPSDDQVFKDADGMGLPRDYLDLAWRAFKHKYRAPRATTGTEATYVDWRAVFRRAVRENWLKLWREDPNGGYQLTTAGVQLQRLTEHDDHPQERAA